VPSGQSPRALATKAVITRCGCPTQRMWNIMLPWNRVQTSSMSIFQTSREHVLVALTAITLRALSVFSSEYSDRLASPSKKNMK
jgi:hypothetical protein